MALFSEERLLLAPVARFIHRRAYRHQSLELPFFEYRIDLFGLSKTRDSTIAVELKLTKWRRAIEQALLYQLGVDYAMIALPHCVVGRVDIKLLERNGIGLIQVASNGNCREILPAHRSEVTRPNYRTRLINLSQGVII